MRLKTLGTLALEDAEFSRPKPLLLAALLTLEGRQARPYLAELFWPEAANPLSSLSTALSQLKGTLGRYLEADRQTVSCTVPCDADQFLKALNEGRLSDATDLYEGGFLQGLSLPRIGAELEEWVYLTRECLALRLRTAILTAGEKRAREGRFAEAAVQAEQVYSFSGTLPLEPEAVARLHRLFAAADHPRLAALERQARRLRLELPSKPQAQAQLRGRPGITATFVYTLPGYETLFVGRTEERAKLLHLLTEHRLITLLGWTGVGKTRLGVQVAREAWQLGLAQDGVGFVSLGAVNRAEGLIVEMARALNMNPDAGLERLAQAVGMRQVLLVLDGFERLEQAAARVLTFLLDACARLRLLVTSHERLNLSAERPFPVAAFAVPEYDALESDDVSDDVEGEARRYHVGLQLFTLRARRARPDFSPDTQDLAAVHELCGLVGGLPLAIELAAAWVSVLSPAEIVAQLKRSLELLSTSSEDVPERHRSLNAALAHSWGLLSTTERDALRRLAIFERRFGFQEATEVTGTTLLTLAGLVDKALLRMTSEGRYERHPLVYKFSRRQLEQNPAELSELRRRLQL